MKKLLSILLLLATSTITVTADKVTKMQAQQIAQEFFNAKKHKPIKAIYSNASKQVINFESTEDYEPFYIYNTEGNNGFVIVSGDDAIGQIIGYSDQGHFDLKDAPSNIVTMMQMYAKVVKYASNSPVLLSATTTNNAKGKIIVSPLLGGIKWGQDAPFNSKFPEYTRERETKHYYVGCVATAAAQIMRYHKYPEHGIGKYTYRANIGKELTADFEGTTYNWNKMPEYLEKNYNDTEENNQVAMLSFNNAVGLDMEFAPNGSGALSQAVCRLLIDNYGYDKGISYRERDYYTASEWIELIKNELNAKRPVFYSASNEDGQGGHAFVCDGYDSNDFVHINWGWYGKSNGFFNVAALNPYDLGIGANGGGYNLQQEIITGIQRPDGKDNKHIWALYAYTRANVNFIDGHGSFPSELLCMTNIKYDEMSNYQGKVGVAITTKENKILKVLKEQDLNIIGITKNKKPNFVQVKVDRISTDVGDIADGTDYKIQFVVKHQNASDYSILRTSKNLPNYGDATVKSGQIVNVIQHKPTPDATLLSKITPDGKLYAKGSALFKMTVHNNSNDFYLHNIDLKFTSKTNPNNTHIVKETEIKLQGAGKSIRPDHNVYDNSTKDIEMLINFPKEMKPGIYKVTAFESKYENIPFKEIAGESTIELLPEVNHPVIRQLSNLVWLNATTKKQEIKQCEKIILMHNVRNYGPNGKVGLLLKLKNTQSNDIIDFFQMDKDFKDQKVEQIIYYTPMTIIPGTYNVIPYFVDQNGNEHQMEGVNELSTIEIKEDNEYPLFVTKFELPTKVMTPGTKYNDIKINIKINKQLDNCKIRVRLAPLTLRGGSLVNLFKCNLPVGKIGEMTINIKPDKNLKKGKYILYMEYTAGKSNIPMPLAGNSRNIVYIGMDPADIKAVKDINKKIEFKLNNNSISFEDYQQIKRIELYDMSGICVFNQAPKANTINLSLKQGMYILRVLTAENNVIISKIHIN